MMTTRWSLFSSVVEIVVVLIFVGGKERGGDRHVFRSETTFSSKLLLFIPSYKLL